MKFERNYLQEILITILLIFVLGYFFGFLVGISRLWFFRIKEYLPFNYKIWFVQLCYYLIMFLIIILVLTYILITFFVHTDDDSSRYMLSALVQCEASIVAIVISLTLVAVQHSASSYSTRIIDIFKFKNPDFWVLIIIYIWSIVFGLFVLEMIKTGNLESIEKYIYLSYSFGAIAFITLIPYLRKTLDLLKPSKIMGILSEDITKENILFALNNNKFEGYNIQSYVNKDKDPIQPVIDIVHSSLKNYDSETAIEGLNVIGYHTNKIFEKDDFKGDEDKKIIEHIIEHLHNVVKHAEKEENDYIIIEIIKVLFKNGFTTANKKRENATISAINELTEILDIVDKNKLLGLPVLAASFYNIEASAAKNGLRTVLESLETPLSKLLSIEKNKGDKGNKFVVDLVEKAIENMRKNLTN
ncbi:MAG: DUF2254 domain-containing protein [Candidatus Methanoperedens sp.]|nr:DUF2254 domain-containing protein [Candidatus Methanoperedens sp.]MCZ7370569.1 DUF2254 domain-containing protein [Candidatus Methanoperedens sp.]